MKIILARIRMRGPVKGRSSRWQTGKKMRYLSEDLTLNLQMSKRSLMPIQLITDRKRKKNGMMKSMKKAMKNPTKMGTKLGGGMMNQKGKKKTSGWKDPKKK